MTEKKERRCRQQRKKTHKRKVRQRKCAKRNEEKQKLNYEKNELERLIYQYKHQICICEILTKRAGDINRNPIRNDSLDFKFAGAFEDAF